MNVYIFSLLFKMLLLDTLRVNIRVRPTTNFLLATHWSGVPGEPRPIFFGVVKHLVLSKKCICLSVIGFRSFKEVGLKKWKWNKE